MTLAENNGPDMGSDDMLAAEYVVGVLPAEERRTAADRIERENAFARLVDAWEVRLSPLASGYKSAEVPAAVKPAIDRRLFSSASTASAERASLWSSLAFWRGMAAAALAALAIYVGSTLLQQPAGDTPQQRLIASLAADGSDVRYLAFYDATTGNVGLSHVSGDRASGRDFELWMIEGSKAPVSMGVIPVGASIHITVDDASRAKLAAGAILAISLEPTGGSPTGQPTGPVVAAGDLKSI